MTDLPPSQRARELLPCPFCKQPMTVLGGVNPYGRCDTEGCWMHVSRYTVTVDDPNQVALWNTRARPKPSADVEARARELLAVEVEKMNRPITAAAIRSGPNADYMEAAAIHAILAALSPLDETAVREAWTSEDENALHAQARALLRPASGIETRKGGDGEAAPSPDESPVAESETQNLSSQALSEGQDHG